MATGFKAFHIYNTVKYIHFNSLKFDIMKAKELPRKAQFLKKWNDEMIHRRESLLFLKLEEKYSEEKLIRLFATYWLDNERFYMAVMFDDQQELFRKNEYELHNIKDVIERDFLKILIWAAKRGLSLKDIFKTDKMSVVFKLYDRKKISANSLLCFDKAFGILGNIDESKLNFVEEEKLKKYKKIIEQYHKIVYKFLDFDVKDHLKKVYERIKNEQA